MASSAVHAKKTSTACRSIRTTSTWSREQSRARSASSAGYGEPFGISDAELGAPLRRRPPSARRSSESSEVVLLPKPLPEDLREMHEGGILWGWPHCVQQREITQIAIDRRLTLIAWEAMFTWKRGVREMHALLSQQRDGRLLRRDPRSGPDGDRRQLRRRRPRPWCSATARSAAGRSTRCPAAGSATSRSTPSARPGPCTTRCWAAATARWCARATALVVIEEDGTRRADDRRAGRAPT